MANSITDFANIKSLKRNFQNIPIVQAIENHEDPISIITRALNRAQMISNVTLQSITGTKNSEGYTQKRFPKAGTASLRDFINRIKKYGTSIKARYEVTFSGIDNLTFFVTDINVPSVRRNFGILHYRGQSVEVPITVEYEHDFNMTVINDGKGLLYPTFVNLLLNMKNKSEINSGYDMTLRIFGDGQNTSGLAVTFFGVRFKTISGLTVNSGDVSISTFTVGCTAIYYDVLAEKIYTNLLTDETKSKLPAIQDMNEIQVSDIVGRIGGI